MFDRVKFILFSPQGLLFLWMAIALLTHAFGPSAQAQELTFRHFTVANGLANNRINRIYQDRKGFMWFATWDGLSRFDGYEFVNYDTSDGLPNVLINDVTEDKQGRLWVAANDDGVAMLNPQNSTASAGAKFRSFLLLPDSYGANKVNRILIDSSDALWCLTDDGVFRAKITDADPKFELVWKYTFPIEAIGSRLLFEDRDGRIWFSADNHLLRYENGSVVDLKRFSEENTSGILDGIQTMDGRILVLHRYAGLYEFVQSTLEWKKIPLDMNLYGYGALLEDDLGNLWINDHSDLLKVSGTKIERFTTEIQSANDIIVRLFQDREGNIWAGFDNSGLAKTSGTAVTMFRSERIGEYLGLVHVGDQPFVYGCKYSEDPKCYLQPFRKGLSAPKQIPFQGIPEISRSFSLNYAPGRWQVIYDFKRGSYLSSQKLVLSSGKVTDLSVYFDLKNQSPLDLPMLLGRDGKLWTAKDGVITDGNSAYDTGSRIDFLADTINGEIWWFRRGAGAGRIHNGRSETIGENFQGNDARSAFGDSRGWMWVGTRFSGVVVCKELMNDTPDCRTFSKKDGLGSDAVWAITEDKLGRMYFGTEKGLSRFDPATGIWDFFVTSSGLNDGAISGLSVDPNGDVWVTMPKGLIRLVPGLEREELPPPTYITSVTSGETAISLPEGGAETVNRIELESWQNDISINYVGISFTNTDTLLYQHKLDGIDANWSTPSKTRSLAFANLSPGNYKLLVRAITPKNSSKPTYASVEFKIYPPIYLRWWFIALSALAIAAAIYLLVRLRTNRLIEIERTRTAIATDLHDDIGSNLSKISVLSEVSRMQLKHEGKPDDKILGTIAEIARDSVSSMKDIVWAIDPKRDSAKQLIRKMREHAEEVFLAQNIELDFVAPDDLSKVKLAMDVRRELFLSFKEMINNISKHSRATKVTVTFHQVQHKTTLMVSDNGTGFDPSEENAGNGLKNIAARVKKMNGRLDIGTVADNGTVIEISLPRDHGFRL